MAHKESWQTQITTPVPTKTNTPLALVKKSSWQARINAMASNENAEQPCWRCHCAVQPEQIRRRLVNTAASRGTHVLTGDTVIPEEYFELVSLCDDCATLYATQQKEKELARARRDAWWGRILLAGGLIVMLGFGRFPLVIPPLLAWLLDRFRVLGPVVVLMVLVFVAEYLLGLRPHRLRGRIVIPWTIIITLGLLWGVWKADAPRWPFGWMARRQKPPAAVSQHSSLLTPIQQKDEANVS